MVLPENGRKQKGHPMFESFKHTAEYKRLQTALQTPGAAALFGMPPVAHARILSELAADGGRSLLVVTPGEAEATRFAQDLEALGMPAAVFPPRDFLLRPSRVRAENTNIAAWRCWAIWWAAACGRCACPPRPCCNTLCPKPSSAPTP